MLTPKEQENLAQLGAFIRDERLRKNPPMNLSDIRRAGGPAVSVLSEIESGAARSFPKPETLRKIARGLDLPIAQVFGVAGIQSGPGNAREFGPGFILHLPELNDLHHEEWTAVERAARHAAEEEIRRIEAGSPPGGGEIPEANPSKPLPALALVDDMGDLTYPPTPEERAILAEADRLGLAFGLFTEPGFWSQPPELRRRLLRDVEGTLEEARDMYRRMGKELPNGS